MKIIWDMDGVVVPGRGTAHLANGYGGDPGYFMNKFYRNAGEKELRCTMSNTGSLNVVLKNGKKFITTVL